MGPLTGSLGWEGTLTGNRILKSMTWATLLFITLGITLGVCHDCPDQREAEATEVLLKELQKRSGSNPKLCEGRLTLTAGTPVTTSDVTAATTVYFTPYEGSKVAVYNGSYWETLSFSEISVAVPATTTTPFDVFAYNNSGTLALSTTNWTSDSVRATGITLKDGVYVKSGATTYRYLGTGRTTGVSGQTEDSTTKRFLWNYYNRKTRTLRLEEGTASWTYATTVTWQAVNASSANRVEVIVGVREPLIKLSSHSVGNTGGGESSQGIGISSTTPNTNNIGRYFTYASSMKRGNYSSLFTYPVLGYSYYQWMEISTSGHTITFYGGPSADDNRRPGLTGSIEG